MRAIYKPRGKAGEYASLAANLFDGCEHGCRYCYVPNLLKIPKAEFTPAMPRLRILDSIEIDARKLSGCQEHILLCFTCDPYPPSDQKPFSITREAIKILKEYGLPVSILTKGGARALRDHDLLTPQDKFGCTLTFADPFDSKKWEPGAELPIDRLFSLHAAHAKGIPTWASLEPIIDPEQTLALITKSRSYVDEYKIGKLNYVEAKFDLRSFGHKLADLLHDLKVNYYIKLETRPFMPANFPPESLKKKGELACPARQT